MSPVGPDGGTLRPTIAAMKVMLAQINPVVGDVAGNLGRIRAVIRSPEAAQAELIVFPEMSLLGYPPRDLLLREGVIESCGAAVDALQGEIPEGVAIVTGLPRLREPGDPRPYNVAAVVTRTGVLYSEKRYLPTYDVFDEWRYFESATDTEPLLFEHAGRRCGLLICEDFWRALDVRGTLSTQAGRYAEDLAARLVARGAELIIIPSASPFVLGKGARHTEQVRTAAAALGVPIVLVNQVGANDDLIFDGRSIVVDAHGGVRSHLASFEMDTGVVDLAAPAAHDAQAADMQVDEVEELFRALVLGVQDYLAKSGAKRTLLGLSGGIDSALVAVIAAKAVGAANVIGVAMPSRYSSEHSLRDAQELADRLGLGSMHTLPIESGHAALEGMLESVMQDGATGLVDENLQARLRGNVLMALSNETGALVLATGNKSEMAMGYCTLYGDMCGAIAVLADVLKTQVYELAKWINAHHRPLGFERPPIPESTITKPPSAELRPNQTDQDTLPPYEVLDQIVRHWIDDEWSAGRIVAETGFEPALVQRITRTIDQCEYKRRQAALVLKVSPRTFGPGRRMPVVMRSNLSIAGQS